MSWKTTANLRNNNFDFLRLFLAVLVIYSHSYALAKGRATALGKEGLVTITKGQMDGGSLAVFGLLIVSGFLIAHSWTSTGSTRLFFYKRVRRIAPGFVVAMIATACLFAPLGSQPWSTAFSASQLAKVAIRGAVLAKYPAHHLMFASNPFPHEVNGSMWTIQYELWCYAILAALGITGILSRRPIVLAAFAGMVTYYFLQQSHFVTPVGWSQIPTGNVLRRVFGESLEAWPRFLVFFYAGVILYVYRDRISRHWMLAALAIAALAVGGEYLVLGWVMPFAFPYLLFWIAFHPAIRMGNFGRYGDFSYGTYLYAFPIQQLVVHWMPSIRPLLLFGIATPIAIAAGLMSWNIVERRFLKPRCRVFVARSASFLTFEHTAQNARESRLIG